MLTQQQELPAGVVFNESNVPLDHPNIIELHSLNNKATSIAKQFLEDLKFFSMMAFDPFAENLLEESFAENITHIQDTTKDVFKKTILKTVDRISNELGEELQKKEGVLFNGFLASASVQILETILEFEKTIDQLFPSASKKIINALGNGLAGHIGVYSPTVGILIKASGAINRLSDFLSCDNLTVTILNLKEKIYKVEQNKKLQKIYKTGTQLAELSKITGISSVSLSGLGLNAKSLAKIIDLCNKGDLDTKLFVKEATEIVGLMPKSKEEVNKIIDVFKDSLLTVVKEQNLSDSAKQSLESKINNRLKDITLGYNEILKSNKSFFARLSCQGEVNGKLMEYVAEFKRDLGLATEGKSLESRIVDKATNLLPKNISLDSTELLKHASQSPIIAKELGLNIQTKILLEIRSIRELAML